MNTPSPRRPSGRIALSDRAPYFAGTSARPAKLILSSAVFNGETEVGIEHHGELYRLKITRQGKLILTK